MKDLDKDECPDKDEIFSKAVRAGKRTYFFDVKSTRKNELYLIITERKRRYEQDGSFLIEKHKIFLYKEDFEKFAEGLSEVTDFIKSNISNIDEPIEEYTQIEFEDLK